MTYSALNSEIDTARVVYRQLRGYLRDDGELDAVDGVFNAIKSPQRLRLDETEATVDQKLESLEHMLTSLHRVYDLLSSLLGRYVKRTHVGSGNVDSELRSLQKDRSFEYLEHFTNGIKHTIYVRRGASNGELYFDAFSYNDRRARIQEPRKTSQELLEVARQVIVLATRVMHAMRYALDGVEQFDPDSAQVCATPTFDPSLYSVEDAEE